MPDTVDGQQALSLEETRAQLRETLRGIVPEFEIDYKAELAHKINVLKREKNAIVLGHNYMEPALYHSVPDFNGDSLELARASAETEADIIVFCGVRFMAETAKILNPSRLVLLPSVKALCSLAGGVSAKDIRALKEEYPGVPVVTYVNTYADAKAESDYCCTSANAAAVVFPSRGIDQFDRQPVTGNARRDVVPRRPDDFGNQSRIAVGQSVKQRAFSGVRQPGQNDSQLVRRNHPAFGLLFEIAGILRHL